jgi:hypothetical protein
MDDNLQVGRAVLLAPPKLGGGRSAPWWRVWATVCGARRTPTLVSGRGAPACAGTADRRPTCEVSSILATGAQAGRYIGYWALD